MKKRSLLTLLLCSASLFAAVPGQVSGLFVTPGDGLVTLAWTAATNTPTDYKIEYKLTSDSAWTTFVDGVSTAVTTTVTGLTDNLSYSFRVSGINGSGTGTASTARGTYPVANAYTFDNDTIGNAPSNTVTLTPASPLTVANVTAVGGKAATCAFTTYCGATLTNFGSQQDYSVVWQQNYSGTASHGGVLLRAQSGHAALDTAHINTGYYFQTDEHQGNLITYAFTSSATTQIMKTGLTAPGAGVNRWYKATVAGDTLTFSYSTDGATWITPTGTTTGTKNPVIDNTFTTGGGTELIPNINQSQVGYSNDNVLLLPPVAVPGAPTSVSASAGAAQATVSFTPPVSNGNVTITSYTVTSSPGNITASGSTSPIVVTGLTNGTAYTFTVTATNKIGTSASSSASSAVTPLDFPGAPTSVAAVSGNTQATVNFSAPASNGGSPITGYTVTSSPGNITASGSASPITVTGLTNGTSYTFTVTAANIVGNSVASSASSPVVPATVPGAPTVVTASGGNTQATVSFTAPASNGGSAITGYTVTSSPGNITATGSGSPITITGLTNLTSYTFTVIAANIVGNSVASSASNSVTPTAVPGPPTGVVAVRSNASASVAFTAGSVGSSPTTGFTVTIMDVVTPSNVITPVSGPSSPIVVSGLTNGRAYSYTVHATNSFGNSLESNVFIDTVPAISYKHAFIAGLQGRVLAPDSIVSTGSAITNYALSGGSTLPAGISLDAVTGVISGTPSALVVTQSDTVLGSNFSGTARAVVTFQNADTLPVISYKRGSIIGTKNVAILADTIVLSDSAAVTSYALSSGSSLPAGISLNSVTGVISGTPTVTFVLKSDTVIATGPGGTGKAIVAVNVSDECCSHRYADSNGSGRYELLHYSCIADRTQSEQRLCDFRRLHHSLANQHLLYHRQ